MSSFGGLSISFSALSAAQLGMEVVGNNIANVSNPSYSRQTLELQPIRAAGTVTVNPGAGVLTKGIARKIDTFLASRAREATSQYQAASARSEIMTRVEGLYNELGDTGLSSSMDTFFSSLQDLTTNPEDTALRNLVVQQAQTVANIIQDRRTALDDVRKDINAEMRGSVDSINNSLVKIRDLNKQIVSQEAGTDSEASSLRNLRDQELASLADKIDITVYEDLDGSVNIYSGNDYLLSRGSVQGVEIEESIQDGLVIQNLVFSNSKASIPTTGGRLGGLAAARDQDIPKLIADLEQTADIFINEFNKIYSQGQGLESFTSVTSTNRVLPNSLGTNTPLDSASAGLAFPPQNGSFEIQLTDLGTGQTTTAVIQLQLDGSTTGTSLDGAGPPTSIVDQINTAFGSTVASVDGRGRLTIAAPDGVEFNFANDTSGFLAGMGINTFFSGESAGTIGINSAVADNPSLFAASLNGNPGDASNAATLANFQNLTFASTGRVTFGAFYAGTTEKLGSLSAAASAQATVYEASKTSLNSESLSITGVNLDEEAIKLIEYQKAFQAASRHISVVNDMLDEILNLVQ